MPHVVCEPCLDCRYTNCCEVCPTESFREGEKMLYIDPDTCIDCEACVQECPVEAIYLDEDVPEKWREYVETNAEMAAKCAVINEKKKPLADQ